MLIDMHVRAPVDDGDPGVAALMTSGAAAGLDGLCLVGDGRVPPMNEARECPEADGLALFFGVELAVEKGHLLWIPADPAVFESDEWSGDPEVPESLEDVLAVADRLGGVLIAVHPYDRSREPLFRDDIYDINGTDAIQVANANLSRIPNNLAIEAAVKMRKSVIGGTGPMRGPGSIGRCCTVFLGDVENQDDLVKAVQRGDTWAVEFLDRLDGRSDGRPRNRGRRRR
ncbi:MAG: hypothetical protein GXP54_01730 [Deltaproteobacteria bacterium]|nr:hypothetical protein [Deltaproteobacteria bacterium]